MPRAQRRNHLAKGILAVEGQPTIVYDTLCTEKRAPWLATSEVHELLVDVWTNATAWVVGRYLIMPDHIHLFAGYREGAISFYDWEKYGKSRFSNRYGRLECRFQSRSFDHRVRSSASYEAEWQYIRENPVRAGLVKRSEDWPFQGEIHQLRWD
jgi:REP element-mobilizing transposase RayT